MIKQSQIQAKVIRGLNELLKHTGQSFVTQGAPTLYYLIKLQSRVLTGSVKIKPTLQISQFRANMLNACLKELLRIAIITGNVSNKSQKQLKELLADLEECVDLVIETLKKSLPTDTQRLALKYIEEQRIISTMQLKQNAYEK